MATAGADSGIVVGADGSQSANAAELGHDQSRILVLSTYDDSRPCALGAGEMSSTVLLECTMAGFATCTLTHMIEVTPAREPGARRTRRSGSADSDPAVQPRSRTPRS